MSDGVKETFEEAQYRAANKIVRHIPETLPWIRLRNDTKPYMEGREAFLNGESKIDCPYFIGDENAWEEMARRHDWMLGYEDAQETAEYIDKWNELERREF